MTPAVLTFLLERVLPFVLKELPTILSFLQANHPQAHTQIVNTVKSSCDQGPNFDWHSGP